MHATDLLSNSDGVDLPDSERLIAVALAEERASHGYSDRQLPLSVDAPRKARAQGVHAAVDAWAAVIRYIRSDQSFAGTHVAGLRELQFTVLRGFATLSV